MFDYHEGLPAVVVVVSAAVHLPCEVALAIIVEHVYWSLPLRLSDQACDSVAGERCQRCQQ